MTDQSMPPFALESGQRRIVLVRHASTAWSKSGRHTGRTDVPLDQDGRHVAHQLRERLGGLEAARVYSSPLSRARDTCDLAGFGAVAENWDELMEWDYGDYEGRTTQEIRADRPGWNVFVDGCPNGEDARSVARRADAVIDRLEQDSGETALLFAHGHFLRVLAVRWLGLDPVEGRHFVLDAGSVSSLGYEREVRALTSWNSRGARGVTLI